MWLIFSSLYWFAEFLGIGITKVYWKSWIQKKGPSFEESDFLSNSDMDLYLESAGKQKFYEHLHNSQMKWF